MINQIAGKYSIKIGKLLWKILVFTNINKLDQLWPFGYSLNLGIEKIKFTGGRPEINGWGAWLFPKKRSTGWSCQPFYMQSRPSVASLFSSQHGSVILHSCGESRLWWGATGAVWRERQRPLCCHMFPVSYYLKTVNHGISSN